VAVHVIGVVVRMVEKVKQGSYKCERCGKVITGDKRAQKHETICGIQSLDNVLDNVENIVHLKGVRDTGKTSRQLKLGESFIGYCSNCETRITSENHYKQIEDRDYYSCPRCEKVVIR